MGCTLGRIKANALIAGNKTNICNDMKKRFFRVSILMLSLILLTNLNVYSMKPVEEIAKQQNLEVKKNRSKVFLLEKDIPWEPADKGITRQIIGYDGQIMMVKVKFEEGAIGAAHTHYHTQVTYVASGKFEFTVGGEKKVIKEGDGIYMEPDVLHGCVCLEAGVLIDCFSPMRESFIK
jgi:quercetin dioxygenase-like cupin family protein